MPDYADALNNLGLALQGLGRHAEAAEHFRHALRQEPNLAVTHANLGFSLHELKEHEQALHHLRRAVELAPQFARARLVLGQMLVERGLATEALSHLQAASRLQPGWSLVHEALASTFLLLGRFEEARAACLQAVRLDPTLARAREYVGVFRRHQEQLGDPMLWLKQAIQREQGNGTLWGYLGYLLSDCGEFEPAIPCWEKAVSLGPAQAMAHNGLALALQEEGRTAEALEQYQAALRLEPDFAPAQLGLGNLHESLGQPVEAERAFRAALRSRPDYALPRARLASLLRDRLPDADLAALEQRLDDPQLQGITRARLLFAVGTVLDARGDYARAATCVRQANALTLEETRREKRDYQPAVFEHFVDELLAGMGADWFGRLAGAGSRTRWPVFVFGLPRSGTSLVEQILASHSQVHGAGELRLSQQSFDALATAVGRTGPAVNCLSYVTPAAIHRLAEQHDNQLRLLAMRANPGGVREVQRVVDKLPDNYIFLGLLAVLFPEAVFIHCRRDPRDVALSCWMTDFTTIRWANDVEHITTRFQQYQRIMEHWHAVLPVRLHHVDYEETVADPEAAARRLIAACGLDWEPACLEFHRTTRQVRTASASQVRQPVYRGSVGRWRKYEHELAELFTRCAGNTQTPNDQTPKEIPNDQTPKDQ